MPGLIFNHLIKTHDLAALKHAHESGYTGNTNTFNIAVYAKNLEILDWIHSIGYSWNMDTIEHADNNTREYLLKKGYFNAYPGLYNGVELNLSLDTLKWMYANGCTYDDETFDIAIENNDLDVLKWLHEIGCRWVMFSKESLINTTPDVIEWLHEIKCWTPGSIFIDAIKRGDIETIKMLISKGIKCSKTSYTIAYFYGRTDIIKILIENNCLQTINEGVLAGLKNGLVLVSKL